jgi:hypothetical protein
MLHGGGARLTAYVGLSRAFWDWRAACATYLFGWKFPGSGMK